MIERRESAFVSLVALDGPMVAACLTSNVAILSISCQTQHSWAVLLLVATAFKLAFTPRDKFIDKQVIWSPAMIKRERSLITAAIVLHLVSCAATLLVMWLTLPSVRPDIPLKLAAAAACGLSAAAWAWLNAKNRWGDFDRISRIQGGDSRD